MTKNALPVRISGIVTRFMGNGRQLGYPTANINTDTTLKDGVYFGYAALEKYNHHPALIFIGVPSTIGDKERRLEAHLLDIEDKDYYGLHIKLELCYFHRPNYTFDSVAALMKVMKADEIAGREWFKGR